MAHGLSYSTACGIFPDQGSNPRPLHWQADPQPLHHQGSPYISVSENRIRGFPGGPEVKNSPSNTGDMGSISGRGTKIPHAREQLSLHAENSEPARSGAHMPQLERSPHATTKTQCSQINKYFLKIKKE